MLKADVIRRWSPFALAALLTVLLAASVSLVTDQFLTLRSLPAPQLKTVSATTLTRLGITLSASPQPPYCGAAGIAVRRGWLQASAVRCAISRDQAEMAARQGAQTRVIESVLALVTASRSSMGANRLDWVVVTQGAFTAQGTGYCLPGVSSRSACGGARQLSWSRLVLVDAYSGAIVSTVPLSPRSPGRPSRALPAGAVTAAD